MSFKYILYCIFLFGLISCKQEIVHPDDIRNQVDESTDLLQFAIMTSNPSSLSTTTLRVVGMQSQEGIKIYSDSTCNTKIADQVANKSILDINLTFTTEGTYNFYYVYTDDTKVSGSCRSTSMSYSYDDTDPTAASFSLSTGSPGNTSLPYINVSSLNSGETVTIYRDSSCKYKVHSFTATSSSAVTEQISIPLPSDATYSFYYTINDEALNYLEVSSNTCLNTTLSYTFDTNKPLPSSGFDFEGAINLTVQKRLRVRNTSNIYSLKIYQESTCSTLLCDSADTSSECVETSSEYYDFKFEADESTIFNYYFKSTDSSGESSCLKVDHFKYNPIATYEKPVFNTVSRDYLYAVNTASVESIDIFSDYTCSTNICTKYMLDEKESCEIDYGPSMSFSFDYKSNPPYNPNYYFRYNGESGYSSCLEIDSYSSTSDSNNQLLEFDVLDQALDNNSAFDITANGVTSGLKVYVYKDSSCSSFMASAISASTTVDIPITLSTAGDYNFYYIVKESAGNYAYQDGSNCLPTNLYYKYDIGAPTNYSQKLIAPAFLKIKGDSVEVTNVNGSIGTFKFSNTTVGETLSIYSGKDCTGSLVQSETILSDAHNVNLSFNAIGDTYISYREGAGSCTNFNFQPAKKDGVENTVIIAFTFSDTNYDSPSTLKIYSKNDCQVSGTELYSGLVTKSNMEIDIVLTNSDQYQFSSKRIDEAGNETSCLAVNSDFSYLEYTYYKIESVSIGANHTCATVEDPAANNQGIPYCWGRNNKGQLGDSNTASYSPIPLLISSSLNATSISTYKDSNCLIGGTGSELYCFGDNTNGILGTGSIASFDATPTPIAGSYKSVTHGANHACVTDNNDAIWCWGDDTYGQVGDNAAFGGVNTSPVQTAPIVNDYTKLSAGANHTCALEISTDQFTCWGQGTSGERGDGEDTFENIGTVPASEAYQFTKVESGTNFSCALNSSGIVYCWGSNDNGQLAGALNPITSTPSTGSDIPLLINTTKTFTDLSVASDVACAIDSTNQLNCWGAGYSEIEAISPSLTFTKVYVGANHNCALTTKGQLLCFGNNNYGQLGIANIESTNIPTPVEFDFNKTSLEVEDSNGDEIIATIDLKTHISTNADQVLYYENSTGSYKTLAGDSAVTFEIVLRNTSLTSATLLDTEMGFTKFGDDDYTNHFDFLGGTYPGTGGTCNTSLNALGTCSIFISYSTDIARADGMSSYFNIFYKDTDLNYSSKIKITGYSQRALAGVQILTEDGSDQIGPLKFGSASEQFNATLLNYKADIVGSYATITNPYTYDVRISDFGITGENGDEYDWGSNNNFATPAAGYCGMGTLLAQNESCVVHLNHLGSTQNPQASASVKMYIVQSIIIKNTNNDSISLTSSSFIGADGNIFGLWELAEWGNYDDDLCESTIAANTQCTLPIVFLPEYEDMLDSVLGFDASLQIVISNTTDSASINIPIEAYAEIFEPEITLTLDNVDITGLPNVYLNSLPNALTPGSGTLNKLITISNIGDPDDPTGIYADAENLVITITGDDASEYAFTGGSFPGTNGTCSTTLATGESCIIDITYTPVSLTSFNGNNVHEAIIKIELENTEHDDAIDDIEQEINSYFILP